VIARLLVQLPFLVAVPDGGTFRLHPYEVEGYNVCVYPPVRSSDSTAGSNIDIKINGVPAFLADLLRIDFLRESFAREAETHDPSHELIRSVVDAFVARLRSVAHAAQVRRVDFPLATYRLTYLDDDENELEKAEGLARERFGVQRSFSYVGLDQGLWEDVHTLPVDFEPQPWDELLLEAEYELPRVGPAIVLAATALEVLIAKTLDALAATSAEANLWSWVNNRSDVLKRPTLEEQYDSLLLLLGQRSLKDEPRLWQLFMNLKSARNSFVHTGQAQIGQTLVSEQKARELIQGASEIVDLVRSWLPDQLRWPVLRHNMTLETGVWLFGRPPYDLGQEQSEDSGGGEI
jgi:hypothetical protein